MKNIFFFFIAISILVFSACETDFELEGEWKDIPVIYAFLSEQDTAHYVRVERAFLEPGGDATAIAQIADSIYYKEDQITVTLEANNESYLMQRVDGNNEGLTREDGVFATTPNYLYKLPVSAVNLQGGKAFTIIVDRGTDTEKAVASSSIVDSLLFQGFPMDGFMKFENFSRSYRLSWRPSGDVARVFDVRMIFRYKESSENAPNVFVDKEVEWVFDEAFVRNDETSLQTIVFPHESFYQFIGSAIETDGAVTRKFDKIFFKVAGTGVEVEEYLRIAGANTGITSSQALPIYTNVEGGLGIVTSRTITISKELKLNGSSRDSLFNSTYTGDLNFVN